MRDYENSDNSSLNTYRSGNENSRRDFSARTDSNSPMTNRQGSNFTSDEHYNNNSVWQQPNDMLRNNDQQMRNQQNQYQPRNNQNRQQSSNNWPSRQQSWPQDNRQNQNNYGNHSQDRDYDQHRAGDRNNFEAPLSRENETWNRYNQNYQNNRQQNNWEQNNQNQNDWDRNRNQYNQQHRYSSDYGYQNNSNQGRGYDENRYFNRRNDNNYNRNHQDNQHEEGFFDRMGNSIRNAWSNFTHEENDDQNRANRYGREHGYNNQERGRNNFGNRNSNSNDGPPYNFGSSSERDYEW